MTANKWRTLRVYIDRNQTCRRICYRKCSCCETERWNIVKMKFRNLLN